MANTQTSRASVVFHLFERYLGSGASKLFPYADLRDAQIVKYKPFLTMQVSAPIPFSASTIRQDSYPDDAGNFTGRQSQIS